MTVRGSGLGWTDVRSADAVALGALALELAGPADRGGALAGALLGRLFVVAAQLHLAIDALALQLFLERAQRLVDIVVANDDLHKGSPTLPLGSDCMKNAAARRTPRRRACPQQDTTPRASQPRHARPRAAAR